MNGMTMNIMWNRNRKNGIQEQTGEALSIGQQIMDSIHTMKEEGRTGETKEAYAARVYAKARSGQKLSPEEMNFLARTNPALYQKVLRAMIMRRALESKLKSCGSKEEAAQLFSTAVESISENDPDRDMLIAALTQAYREFMDSDEYARLPEKEEEEAENKKSGAGCFLYEVNEKGYQEVYLPRDAEKTFAANG